MHVLPLYLMCLDVLSLVSETSYGVRVGFIGSTHSLHYLFIYLFICIGDVNSTLIQLIKQNSFSNKRIENKLASLQK